MDPQKRIADALDQVLLSTNVGLIAIQSVVRSISPDSDENRKLLSDVCKQATKHLRNLREFDSLCALSVSFGKEFPEQCPKIQKRFTEFENIVKGREEWRKKRKCITFLSREDLEYWKE